MRCLARNKRKLYLCQEYQDGQISKFKSPVPIKTNYNFTNSEGDLIALGMDFPMYIRIKTDKTQEGIFKAGDRLYIGIEPPKEYDPLCKQANYEVDSDPSVSLNFVEVTLKKLSGK